MSAYLINPEDYADLSNWALKSFGIPNVEEILIRQNLDSVRCRYPDNDSDAKAVKAFLSLAGGYKGYLNKTRKLAPNELTNAQALRIIANIDYQSCETLDYEKTQAYKLMTSLIELGTD